MRAYSLGVYFAVVATGAGLALEGVHVLGQTLALSLHKPVAARPLSRVEERLRAQAITWVAPVSRTRTTPGAGQPVVPAAILALQLDAAEQADGRPVTTGQALAASSASVTASTALAPSAIDSAKLEQLTALKPRIEKKAIDVGMAIPVRASKTVSKKRGKAGALIAGCSTKRCNSQRRLAKVPSKGLKLLAFKPSAEELELIVFKPRLRRRDSTPGELMFASLIGRRS